MSVILSEAFKKLDILSEDTFDLSDEGIKELSDFTSKDEIDDTIKVIDDKADDEDELQDSYIGNVILDCEVCHSKLYRKPEEVTIDEDGELANVGEECPFCYTADGYKVIGQVSNYEPVDAVKVEVEGEEDNLQTEIETKTEESFKSRRFRKGLSESAKAVYTKPNGDYLVKGNGGYTAFNKNDVCLGGISVTDEYIAIQCFKRNEFDESYKVDEAGNMSNYVDRRPDAGGFTAKDLYNVYETDLNGRKCIASSVNVEQANKLRKRGSLKGFITVHHVDKDPYAKKDESVSEALEKVEITADGQKYTVEAEASSNGEGEMVAPLTDDTISEIESNGEEDVDAIDGTDDVDLTDEGDFGESVDMRSRKGKLTEAPIYDLSPQHDSRQSFYNKAKVDTGADNKGNALYSYNTKVAELVDGKPVVYGTYSQTTLRHIKEWLKQLGFRADNSKQIMADYGVKEESVEVDVDEFDEKDFDRLGEGYFREVYDNVKSYRTIKATSKGNSIKLEGIISFKSGKQKKTQFIFEAKDMSKRGKARFIGENAQICRGKKAFTVTGSIENKKFLPESFNYNYRAKVDDGTSKRVYGTIKRK